MLEELGEAFGKGSSKPSAHVEACLERIEQREPEICAWVEVDREGALAAAAESDRRWREGVPRSPLEGMTVGVKDIIDVAGKPTSVGVDGWAMGPARCDAEIVRRLRGLGAVVLGKTVTTPFACFDPSPTRHPWRTGSSPGGSSSGSAAAVADGHVAWALGSQTGGSIVRPAAYCGIVGFKPSFGRLPLDGVFPIASRLDHLGFLCREPSDAAVIWETLTGERVAHLETFRAGTLEDVQGARADSLLLELWPRVVQRCRDAGAQVAPVRLPVEWDTLLEVHGVLMAYEAAQVHAATYAQRRSLYPPGMRRLIERGQAIARSEFDQAVARQQEWQQEMERWWDDLGVDFLLMWSAPGTAPSHRSTTGDPLFNSPWSLLGVPTLTVPVGRAADGMPVGLQWVGRVGADASVLGAGKWCQMRGVCCR